MTCLLNMLSPAANTERHARTNNHDTDIEDEGSSSRDIREIRFEDSPPAAVEAVVRFIYLGQKPAIEPFCGYTVKDLMLLSTYLEIGCLQNHCVDIVLGRFRDSDEEECPPTLFCDGVEDVSWASLGRWHSHHAFRSHASPWRGSLSSISADGLIQVLFDWGYRFPKIRRAIVQALVFDYGYMFADPGTMDVWLDRFSAHEAYGVILHQLVEEQLALVYHNSAPFSRLHFR
ncbi:hypothetical protein BGZ72_008347 [Mortierella alpina]|nr:hypothetical protein BGZ72_008347 [Mortierella alpina]